MITDQEVLSSFWMPKGYCNTVSSGCNQYTIIKQYWNLDNFTSKQFRVRILPHLDIVPFPPHMKRLQHSNHFPEGFCDIINDALDDVKSGKRGILFSMEQVVMFLRFLPHSNVERIDDFYYVSCGNVE